MSNVASNPDSITHVLWRGSSVFLLVMDRNRKGKEKIFFFLQFIEAMISCMLSKSAVPVRCAPSALSIP